MLARVLEIYEFVTLCVPTVKRIRCSYCGEVRALYYGFAYALRTMFLDQEIQFRVRCSTAVFRSCLQALPSLSGNTMEKVPTTSFCFHQSRH